jgi:hypothetical protein
MPPEIDLKIVDPRRKLFLRDRDPVHQRFRQHQRAVQKHRMPRRDIQIPRRHPLAQRPRPEPHRHLVAPRFQHTGIITLPADPLDFLHPAEPRHHPVADPQILDANLPGRRQDLRPAQIAQQVDRH